MNKADIDYEVNCHWLWFFFSSQHLLHYLVMFMLHEALIIRVFLATSDMLLHRPPEINSQPVSRIVFFLNHTANTKVKCVIPFLGRYSYF